MRQYSAEEKKEYRRNQMQQLEDQLKTGVETFFTSDRFKEFLSVMAKFHDYSFNNCILIAMQKPDATYVAGYHKWVNDFHRVVRKGEKGIRILFPMTHKKQDANTGEETTDIYFRPTSVFDISQTIPIPDMEPVDLEITHQLTSDVKDYDNLWQAIIQTAGIPVSFEDISGGAKGYYSLTDKKIVIQKDMPELQTVKTMLHELTHSVLHSEDALKDKTDKPDRETMEIQAEGTAYMLCQMLGLPDTGEEYSFPYIAVYAGNSDMKKLKASMTLIRGTAANLYDRIAAEYEKKA